MNIGGSKKGEKREKAYNIVRNHTHTLTRGRKEYEYKRGKKKERTQEYIINLQERREKKRTKVYT